VNKKYKEEEEGYQRISWRFVFYIYIKIVDNNNGVANKTTPRSPNSLTEVKLDSQKC